MKKIFLDANVALDLAEQDSAGYADARDVANIIRRNFGKPFVTPATVVILWFYVEKKYREHLLRLGLPYKDKKPVKSKVRALLSIFWFTDETRKDVEAAMASDWDDLEDAIQYQSALTAGMDLIITKDIDDFRQSQIRYCSPELFKQLFYSGRLFGR